MQKGTNTAASSVQLAIKVLRDFMPFSLLTKREIFSGEKASLKSKHVLVGVLDDLNMVILLDSPNPDEIPASILLWCIVLLPPYARDRDFRP